MVLWRRKVRRAREQGDRLAAESRRKENSFAVQRDRVNRATTRAESAAVSLMRQHDDLAAAIARGRG